ncbi:MAG: ribosomal RNA small subunit methyltransferase A [Candidatus Aminicenantes bacterium]|nr:ribosomal RNA small subunit methyltransferase A [Candidatus Aminicenantes bacterium]
MNPVSIGQHFLTNQNIARKMIDLLFPIEGPILEIGPGKGVLSNLLIKCGKEQEIILVEMDKDLFRILKKKFRKNCTLINANILDIQLEHLSLKENIICVGNIPYYISKDLIDWTIKESKKIQKGIYMMQKEFVDKIIPLKNSKKKNPQALMFEYIFLSQKKFDIQPGSFSPPPGVISTVFIFQKRPDRLILSGQPEFYQFLKICFSSRRKTLMNTLSKIYKKEKLISIFKNKKISTDIRAEQLELSDFIDIHSQLKD